MATKTEPLHGAVRKVYTMLRYNAWGYIKAVAVVDLALLAIVGPFIVGVFELVLGVDKVLANEALIGGVVFGSCSVLSALICTRARIIVREDGLETAYSNIHATPLRAKVLLGVIVLLFGIFCLSSYFSFAVPMRYNGVTMEGVVTSRSTHECGEDCVTYIVAYSWVVGGHRFSSQSEDPDLYNNHIDGSYITLMYMPNDPGVAEPKEELTSWRHESLAWIGGTLVVASLGYIISSMRQTWRRLSKSHSPI